MHYCTEENWDNWQRPTHDPQQAEYTEQQANNYEPHCDDPDFIVRTCTSVFFTNLIVCLWTLGSDSHHRSMSVSRTFIGSAVSCREFESEAPAAEEMLAWVVCSSEQFCFQMCLEGGDGSGTFSRWRQRVPESCAAILKALDWKLVLAAQHMNVLCTIFTKLLFQRIYSESVSLLQHAFCVVHYGPADDFVLEKNC